MAATNAELYLANLSTMFMDAIHDHTTGMDALNIRRHTGLQQEFGRFTAWCDSSFICVLNGRNFHRTVEEALHLADQSSGL